MTKKRQHYLPQFYLRRFGEPLFRFDKTNNKIEQRNPRTIASEKNFYEIDGLEHGTIEDFFSENETKFSIAYTKLIETKDLRKLTSLEYTDILLFLGTQLLRATVTRYDLKNVTEQFYKLIFGEKGMNMLPKEVKITFTEESIRKLQFELLGKAPEIALLFSKKTWVIEENNSCIPLWSSDNPIAFHNDYKLGPFLGTLGINSPGVEIHFPLTPTLKMLSYDPNLSKIKNEPMNKEHVRRHNCYQVINSVRYIFSPVNDFQDAISYLEKHEELRDPKRYRTTVNRT